MPALRHVHCSVQDIRFAVQRQLRLPGAKGVDQPDADEFWTRAERQGRLAEAVALYDRIAADWDADARVPRETKARFWARVEREGRRAEAERVLAELLALKVSQREAQDQLVERFQPQDGGRARAWQTPDPWESGRLFRRRADQDELLAKADGKDEDDIEQETVESRVYWARLRQEERFALTAARQRVRELAKATPGALPGAPLGAPAAVQPAALPGVSSGVA